MTTRSERDDSTIRMELRIQTTDRYLPFEVFGTNRMTVGDRLEITPGATVTWNGSIERKGLGIPSELIFVITFGSEVAAIVIGNWITEKLRGRDTRHVSIDRTEIHLENGEITRVIQEKIDSRRK